MATNQERPPHLFELLLMLYHREAEHLKKGSAYINDLIDREEINSIPPTQRFIPICFLGVLAMDPWDFNL